MTQTHTIIACLYKAASSLLQPLTFFSLWVTIKNAVPPYVRVYINNYCLAIILLIKHYNLRRYRYNPVVIAFLPVYYLLACLLSPFNKCFRFFFGKRYKFKFLTPEVYTLWLAIFRCLQYIHMYMT